MKYYKAIFNLPDDLIPPPTVGFQINIPIQTPQGIQIKDNIFTTALIPIKSVVEDCEDFIEVDKTEEEKDV